MGRLSLKCLVPALLGVILLAGSPRVAAAGVELAGDESSRLERGETVIFDQVMDRGPHRYVGGTTYTIIDASKPELEALFGDMKAYQQLLPRTKQARLVGVNDNDFFVELRQGNSLLETSYTIRVQRDSTPVSASSAAWADAPRSGEPGTIYRFWLDRSKPHGIEDAWGYFRLEPLPDGPAGPRVLLTYGILVDIGPGLVRELFEERLRQLALTVPQLMRRYALAHFRPRGGRA
jgi:hypothetical protein